MKRSSREVSIDEQHYRNAQDGDGSVNLDRVKGLEGSFQGAFAEGVSTEVVRRNLEDTFTANELGVKKIKPWWAIARKLLGNLNDYVRVPLQNVVIQNGLMQEIRVAIPNNLYEDIASFLLDSVSLLYNAQHMLENAEVDARLDELYLAYESTKPKNLTSKTDFKSQVITEIVNARKFKITRSIAPDSVLHYFATIVKPTAVTVPSDSELKAILNDCREIHTMMLSNVNPMIVHNKLKDSPHILAGATILRGLHNPYTVAMRTLDAVNMYMEDQQFLEVTPDEKTITVRTGDDRLVWLDWEDDGVLGSWHNCLLRTSNIPDLEYRHIYACYVHCLSLFAGSSLDVTSVEQLRRFHSIGISYVPALAEFDAGTKFSEEEISLLVRRIITFFYLRSILSKKRGDITNELDSKYQANMFRAREGVDLEGVTNFIVSAGTWFDSLCDACAFFNELLRTRDIFIHTPKLRDKLLEKVDKFILSNLSEPEKTGVIRSEQGPGYLSDINRILSARTPEFKSFSYNVECLVEDEIRPKHPVPRTANNQGYLTYSMINKKRSSNFIHTKMSWLFATSAWNGSFSSRQILMTKLPLLGGTAFDNFFSFLHPDDLKKRWYPLVHKNVKYQQITRLQDIATLGDLDIYIQFSMLDQIAMISQGNYVDNTWVATIPMIDPDLVVMILDRDTNFMVEEFDVPGTDKYVACVDWPLSMVRVEQHHIQLDQSHIEFLNKAISVWDNRFKYTLTQPTTNKPTKDMENIADTEEKQDIDMINDDSFTES